jgi:hypothetical protein
MRVKSYDSLEQLAPRHLDLFERSAKRSFYYGLPWFRNFVANGLDQGDALRIYVAESGESATALASIVVRYSKTRSIWSSRKLSALSNFYTARFSPVWNDSQTRSEALSAIAKAIAGERPRWDVLDFMPLDTASPCYQEISDALRQAGFVVQQYSCFGDWFLPVGGRCYRDYFASLPATLRNTVNRKTKKLQNTSRVDVAIVSNGEQLERRISDYEKVYKSSWKRPEPYPNFTAGLVRTSAEKGWLRLGVLYVNSEPAAAQIWLIHNKIASIYKLAYDDRFSAQSVGTILSAKMMEYVLDVDRVDEVDYLHGDEPYKRDWMSHRRERWGVAAYNPATLRGAADIVRNIGGRFAKRSLRRIFEMGERNRADASATAGSAQKTVISAEQREAATSTGCSEGPAAG